MAEQDHGRMLSSTGEILEQQIYRISRLSFRSEQKNMLQYLNVKHIRCETAALEGSKPINLIKKVPKTYREINQQHALPDRLVNRH